MSLGSRRCPITLRRAHVGCRGAASWPGDEAGFDSQRIMDDAGGRNDLKWSWSGPLVNGSSSGVEALPNYPWRCKRLRWLFRSAFGVRFFLFRLYWNWILHVMTHWSPSHGFPDPSDRRWSWTCSWPWFGPNHQLSMIDFTSTMYPYSATKSALNWRCRKESSCVLTPWTNTT